MRNFRERPEGDEDENITTSDIVGRTQTGSMGQTADVIPFEKREMEDSHEPFLSSDETQQMRSRWTDIQSEFVDEPRKSVEAADNLVANAIKRIAETFSDERQRLEAQWSRGDEVSTEDLRVALQRYRSFFGRLLSM